MRGEEMFFACDAVFAVVSRGFCAGGCTASAHPVTGTSRAKCIPRSASSGGCAVRGTSASLSGKARESPIHRPGSFACCAGSGY